MLSSSWLCRRACCSFVEFGVDFVEDLVEFLLDIVDLGIQE